MPPRKTKGKKKRTIRKRLSSAARGAKRRASAAARYARRNKGRIAAGLAAAGALGLGGFEGMRARQRYNLDREWPDENKARLRGDYDNMESSNYDGEDFYIKERRRLQSPTLRFFRGLKNYPYKDIPSNVYRGAKMRADKVNRDARRGARKVGRAGSEFLERLFPERKKRREMRELEEMRQMLYGKRKRRRRRKKKFGGSCPSHSYGKKASKKPSAATRRMCKKLKVRLTTKRGGKRVYKSEAMLKKQCKKAMKRKSKK
jgi:hypothetical protein